ncbi:aldehyde dehydrogenase family protein [soil metagenome]
MAYKLLIDGALQEGDDILEVINPATRELLGVAPKSSLAQLEASVASAKRAFPIWAATSLDTRRAALVRIADIIADNADELARLLTSEQGKPLPEANREVGGMSAFFRYCAGLDLKPVEMQDKGGRLVEFIRKPLGVVVAIIPWNFPLMTIAFKMPFALLAGNTVIVKPAPTTPLSTLMFFELIADVLPPGVANVVVDNNDLGHVLTSHPDVRKVSFTGSTATGRKVMGSAADTLKRLTLELGGNDAAIVLPDVDVSKTAPILFQGAFLNAGQVCLAIKRLYVHDSIYDAMCEELARLADAAVVGNGLHQGTQIGPVQNQAQYDKISALIDQSQEDGHVIAGGLLLDQPGYFVRPTIVRDIDAGTRLVDEEQFGPILPVIRFTDTDLVIAASNDSDFALGASIWSGDLSVARVLAGRIDAGTVWINKHADLAPHIPFGGAKTSGIGVEFGEQGLHEFTQLQVISSDVVETEPV